MLEEAAWAGPSSANPLLSGASDANPSRPPSMPPHDVQASAVASQYEGKIVKSVQIPGAEDGDRAHILQMLPQKMDAALDRARVRDSIRTLYATGRYADIQAEVQPSGDGVTLTFVTSPNFFVGAVNVEGAPVRPTPNQIINASKL